MTYRSDSSASTRATTSSSALSSVDGYPPQTVASCRGLREPHRQSRNVLHRRQVQTVFLADALRGHAPNTILRRNFAATATRAVDETAISPRFGATITIPRLNWTFRAFYGHYYQAPPIETRFWSGPDQLHTGNKACNFIPLHGERDEEHQFGVTIPYHGWVLDADNFKTNVANFLDHNNIGASKSFSPSPFQAWIRGWELTLRSPRIAHRAQIHLAYSNQIAEGSGIHHRRPHRFHPAQQPPFQLGPLDHDQRNTLNLGGDITLPWRSYASTNVYYGSGFTNAFRAGPIRATICRQHTTFDLSLGKDFGERFSASVTALNVANRRVDYDNSLTFGGFHWNLPREIYIQLRYRFHY